MPDSLAFPPVQFDHRCVQFGMSPVQFQNRRVQFGTPPVQFDHGCVQFGCPLSNGPWASPTRNCRRGLSLVQSTKSSARGWPPRRRVRFEVACPLWWCQLGLQRADPLRDYSRSSVLARAFSESPIPRRRNGSSLNRSSATLRHSRNRRTNSRTSSARETPRAPSFACNASTQAVSVSAPGHRQAAGRIGNGLSACSTQQSADYDRAPYAAHGTQKPVLGL